jgi:hypothetical protein
LNLEHTIMLDFRCTLCYILRFYVIASSSIKLFTVGHTPTPARDTLASEPGSARACRLSRDLLSQPSHFAPLHLSVFNIGLFAYYTSLKIFFGIVISSHPFNMKTQSTRHHLNWLQHGSTQEAALKASALHWTTAIKIVPAAPTTSQDFTQLLPQPLPWTSHLPCFSEDRVKPHSGATSASERPATVAAVPTIIRQQPPDRTLCHYCHRASHHQAVYSTSSHHGITCHHPTQ